MTEWNERDHPRKGKGSAGGEGGRFIDKPAQGDDVDLNALTLSAITADMRDAAIRDRTLVKSAEETRALLAQTAEVRMGPNGPELYDRDGRIVFRSDPSAPGLDVRTMRADPNVRRAVLDAYRSDLSDLTAAERRATVREATRFATPYARRVAVDSSPNRRYLPSSLVARSLKRRRDRAAAVETLVALHYEDANASAAVVRAGFPDDKASAMSFINKTKFKRDRDGKVVMGDFTPTHGKHKGETYHGMLPERKGSAMRSYLRMLYQPTNGVPDRRTVKEMSKAMGALSDTPDMQAQAFWEMCYGAGTPSNLKGDTDMFKRMLGSRKAYKAGFEAIGRASRGRGQGNAARMVAYEKVLTREAAVLFCAMEPGDGRFANTMWTRRRRGSDGAMHDVRPKRLTEMRSYIRAVYQINNDEVERARASMIQGE